ncbi:MAG TPA: lysylphosphatidylglycerol synthase transmembrane domain-containing protein [Gaiellaceae bacterium]|nr:lysylphosphatidylglycerol synthase transmembrane domain-containing protein [Gaiellaceae bacterium]
MQLVARAPAGPPQSEVRRPWLIAAAAVVAIVVVVAVAAGWDMTAWLGAVWDSLTSVSLAYLVPALALQTLQIAFAAAAWHGILRYAYPETRVRYLGVLACYATGVALNSVTPAHAGTLVTVLMFVAIIPAATVAGVVAAAAVEKLFFAVAGVVVFLYLFLSVGGSFERKFGFLSSHPWATVLAAAAAAIVIGLGGTLAWRRLKRLWEDAKQGGKILSNRRAYVTKVLFPQLLAWCCKVGVVAILLAAYGIPVGFHTLFSVLGGNTLANVASLTPGGVGVNQAFNVASLQEATSAATASAYSVGHQLLSTIWNIALAAVLVAVAFGRSGGKRLVEESATRAKELRAAPPA